jgi:hypothetical protein
MLATAALAVNPATDTTSTNQDLTVEIDLTPDPGANHWLGEPLQASAWAMLGEGDFANIVYVLDVSGSMENSGFNPFQDINPPPGIGAEDDCNGDGVAGSALDSACFGLIALNNSLGSAVNLDVGMVAFGDGAKIADMDPSPGLQAFTSPPDVDGDAIGGADVDQVIRSTDTEFGGASTAGIGLFTADFSAGFAGNTDYDAALSAMNAAFATEPASDINRAVFISDGEPSVFTTGAGSPLDGVAPGTIVDTYGIGSIAPGSCAPGQPLRTISDQTGGTCTEVADPSTLSTVLPAALTNISSLDLKVNGISVGNTVGSEPVSMHVNNVEIGAVLVPGANLIEATAVAEDGTTVTADVIVEVIDMTLDPFHAVNELGSDNEHTVTATLLGSPAQVAGRTVTFEVTGQNPTGPTDVVTDGSGSAEFSYTVPIEPDSLGLDTISATVDIDGHSVTLEVTKEWVDTTPPVAVCLEATNPHGSNIPKAPGNGGQGQNQDGFYELGATDDVFTTEDLQVFVEDTGSGWIFGPFSVGTRIKYTEANGATPSIKPMGGNNGNGNGAACAVDWHIKGTGDLSVTAVDGSGNMSAPVSCLVPPPPK